MPLFALHSPFDEVVEAATPAVFPENDAAVISKFLPVADKINACPPGSKAKSGACGDCIRSTWKQVKNADPLIGLHAVSLLDFLVKNCGVQFLAAFDDREFVVKMRDFVKQKLEDNGNNAKTNAQRRVAEALKVRIQEWAEGEMKHVSWFPVGPFVDQKKERSNVRGLYNVLRRQGYAFPLRRPVTGAASAAAAAAAAADSAKESEFERREREELNLAIQASLKEAEVVQPKGNLYPNAQLQSPQHHQPQNYHHQKQHQLDDQRRQQQQQDDPRRQQQQQQQQPLASPKLFVASYDFEAMESDELTLRAGDVISVNYRQDAHWWRGENVASGREGLFPASFVEEKSNRRTASCERNDSSASSSSAAATSAAAAAVAAAGASAAASPEATAVRVDEEKLKMALHLIQQMDPGKPIGEEEDRKLKRLELECDSMSGLIDSELQSTDRQHLQLMQLNKKLADAMQMYHFLMISETARTGSDSASPP